MCGASPPNRSLLAKLMLAALSVSAMVWSQNAGASIAGGTPPVEIRSLDAASETVSPEISDPFVLAAEEITVIPESKIVAVEPLVEDPQAGIGIIETDGLEWLLDDPENRPQNRAETWSLRTESGEPVELRAVPEPGTVVFLILTAFFVIAWLRRHRRAGV